MKSQCSHWNQHHRAHLTPYKMRAHLVAGRPDSLIALNGGLLASFGGLVAVIGGLIASFGGLVAVIGGLIALFGGLTASFGGLVAVIGGD